eukprot:GGOE01006797.1.p1 GENE.GGOE01006797.1~~GGOE01006797.1.p1  ORF type:complete len:238 (+),score=3.66 GGOE01006797.1:811-1524(+)
MHRRAHSPLNHSNNDNDNSSSPSGHRSSQLHVPPPTVRRVVFVSGSSLAVVAAPDGSCCMPHTFSGGCSSVVWPSSPAAPDAMEKDPPPPYPEPELGPRLHSVGIQPSLGVGTQCSILATLLTPGTCLSPFERESNHLQPGNPCAGDELVTVPALLGGTELVYQLHLLCLSIRCVVVGRRYVRTPRFPITTFQHLPPWVCQCSCRATAFLGVFPVTRPSSEGLGTLVLAYIHTAQTA